MSEPDRGNDGESGKQEVPPRPASEPRGGELASKPKPDGGHSPDGVFGEATLAYEGKAAAATSPTTAGSNASQSAFSEAKPAIDRASEPESGGEGEPEARDTAPMGVPPGAAPAADRSSEESDSARNLPPAEAGQRDDEPAPGEPSGDEDGATIQITYYGKTNVGLIREHNEDNFLLADFGSGKRDLNDLAEGENGLTVSTSNRGTLLAVCDGMGGAAAGEVASQMAVDTLFEYFSSLSAPRDRDHFARRIVAAVEEAGGRIFSAAKADRTRRGMGTTATVAGLMDKVLFVGQVGDSRAYVLRDGNLVQITKDQSLVNQLIEAGQLTEDEAEAFEHSNIILQALGTTEDVTVDLTFLELRRGDRLLMCSDGLSGLVHQDMIRDVLMEETSLETICDRLIDMANTGGGHDNITVVCADFGGSALKVAKEDEEPIYQQYPLPAAASDEHRSIAPKPRRTASTAAAAESPVPGYEPVQPDYGDASSSKAAGWLVGLALATVVVLVIGTILYWMSPTMEGGGGEGPSTVAADPEVSEVDPLTTKILSGPAMVRVTVTGIEGELWVDETRYELPAGIRAMAVEVEPGVHTFESRNEDGHAVAQEIRQIKLGEPAVVALVPVDESNDGSAEELTATPADDGESGAQEEEGPQLVTGPVELETPALRPGPERSQRPSRTTSAMEPSMASTMTSSTPSMGNATGNLDTPPRGERGPADELGRPRQVSTMGPPQGPSSSSATMEDMPDNPFD